MDLRKPPSAMLSANKSRANPVPNRHANTPAGEPSRPPALTVRYPQVTQLLISPVQYHPPRTAPGPHVHPVPFRRRQFHHHGGGRDALKIM